MELTIALTQVINDFEGMIRNMDTAVRITIIVVSVILSFVGVYLMDEPMSPEEEPQDHLGGMS